MIVEFPHFSANLKKERKKKESKAHTVWAALLPWQSHVRRVSILMSWLEGVHNKHCYPTHLLALSAAPETFNPFVPSCLFKAPQKLTTLIGK